LLCVWGMGVTQSSFTELLGITTYKTVCNSLAASYHCCCLYVRGTYELIDSGRICISPDRHVQPEDPNLQIPSGACGLNQSDILSSKSGVTYEWIASGNYYSTLYFCQISFVIFHKWVRSCSICLSVSGLFHL
jgi:hypothetical protein